MKPIQYLALLFLAVVCATCTPSINRRLAAEGERAYVGTYTRDEGWVNGQAAGLYALTFGKDGRATGQAVVAEITNPSFVVEAGNGQVYAVSELAREGEPTGYLHVLDPQQGYAETGKVPTGGKAPCHIELDRTERYIVTTNYVGGNARVYRHLPGKVPIITDNFDAKTANGDVGTPHLHASQFHPNNRLLAMADLGLDRVWFFTLDAATGKLAPYLSPYVQLAQGAGPRHLQWSGDGRFLYVINELNATVSVIALTDAGGLYEIQILPTLPESYTGKNSCADLHLHPNGRFLYGSNRGHNSLVIYAVDPTDGRLTLLGHHPTGGDFPRNFAISPDGERIYVANQNSGLITTHLVDKRTGLLTAVGPSGDIKIPTPVCIEF